jgi:hypothetical protein
MSQSPAPFENEALTATLDEVAPTSSTACAGWSAHDIAAHLAAGSKEIADLIENKLAGRPERATRDFAEREAPFAALSNVELRRAMATEGARKRAASEALAESDDPSFQFTGRSFDVALLSTHSRSEAALHRWDVAGEDDISEQLLTQPDLTRHAVDVLNTLPSLYEAPEWRAEHAGVIAPVRIVLRSPHTTDIVYEHTLRGARFEIVEDGPASGDAVVTTDAANRLLTIWGRRSRIRLLDVDTDSVSPQVVDSILWAASVPWPVTR